MKLVREYIEFEKGKDPKRAMGIGKFYEIWRKEHDKKPIIKISADLSRFENDKAQWEIYLFYEETKEKSMRTKVEEIRDTLYFDEENRLGPIGKLKPEQYFPDPEEAVHYSNPQVFDKEIIDTLEDKGDEGARDLIEGYIKEWWEDERGLEGILKNWFKSDLWIVDNVKIKSLL